MSSNKNTYRKVGKKNEEVEVHNTSQMALMHSESKESMYSSEEDSDAEGSAYESEISEITKKKKEKIDIKMRKEDTKDYEKNLITSVVKRRAAISKRRSTVAAAKETLAAPPAEVTSIEKSLQIVKKVLKAIDTIAAIIAILNSMFSIIESDYFYKVKYDSTGTVVIKESNVSDKTDTSLRTINMLMSLTLDVLIILHYGFLLRKLKMQNLKSKDDNIFSSGLFPTMVLEIILCSVCCPPGIDATFQGKMLNGSYVYSIDAIVNVATMVKGYLIFRTYGHYSRWTNDKASKICLKAKCSADFKFAIKCELKKRPFVVLLFVCMLTLIYGSVIIRTLEIPYSKDGSSGPDQFNFTNFTNTMWLLIVTMTTVGYGDKYPSTHMGRAFGVLCCIIGMVIVSLITVSLGSITNLNAREEKAYGILKKMGDNESQIKDKAADLIRTAIMLKKASNSKTQKGYASKFIFFLKLKRLVRVYKDKNRVATSHLLPLDTMLKNLHTKLTTDIDDVFLSIDEMPNFVERFSKLKEKQNSVLTEVNQILAMQNEITLFVLSTNNGEDFIDTSQANVVRN